MKPSLSASAREARSDTPFDRTSASGLWTWRSHGILAGVVTPPQPVGRKYLEVCLVFMTFVFPAYLSGSASGTLSVVSALLPVMATAIPQAALLVYLLALQGEARRPELGLRLPSPSDLLRAAVLLCVMLALAGAAALALSRAPETTRQALRQGARFRLGGWRELPAAALFCLVAATREEILFRSYLFVRFRDLGLAPPASLAVCAVLFAAAHGYQGPLAVALALVQGLLLGFAFTRARSIGVPIVAHAAHNLIVLAATLLPGGGIFL